MPTTTLPAPVSSKKKHGLGHIPDKRDPRDFRATTLLGAPNNLSAEASLEPWLQTICNQLDSSSCVANAIANAIDIRLREMGFQAPFPSRLAIYAEARELGSSSLNDALADEGSMPSLAFKAIRDIGVLDEAKWPFDLANVNTKVPWDVVQNSSSFRIGAWYRIVPTGYGRTVEIAHAIDQGFPVPFGTLVDDAFMNWEPNDANHRCNDPIPLYDANKGVGGHMLLAIGYTTLPDGRRRFRCVNSWGQDWGDKGLFYVDEEWLAQDVVSDAFVLTVSAM